MRFACLMSWSIDLGRLRVLLTTKSIRCGAVSCSTAYVLQADSFLGTAWKSIPKACPLSCMSINAALLVVSCTVYMNLYTTLLHLRRWTGSFEPLVAATRATSRGISESSGPCQIHPPAHRMWSQDVEMPSKPRVHTRQPGTEETHSVKSSHAVEEDDVQHRRIIFMLEEQWARLDTWNYCRYKSTSSFHYCRIYSSILLKWEVRMGVIQF